ncbi:hypothetical protein BAE44_0010209, partial [Dichanthelium oligosanthes]
LRALALAGHRSVSLTASNEAAGPPGR